MANDSSIQVAVISIREGAHIHTYIYYLFENIKKDIHIKCLPLPPTPLPSHICFWWHNLSLTSVCSSRSRFLCIFFYFLHTQTHTNRYEWHIIQWPPSTTHQAYNKISILLHFLNFIRTEKLFFFNAKQFFFYFFFLCA